jgi:hypothetical protein
MGKDCVIQACKFIIIIIGGYFRTISIAEIF